MKTKVFVLISIVFVLIYFSCKPSDASDDTKPGEKTVTVEFGPNSVEKIFDYQANVKTYYSNDRTAQGQKLCGAYKLSTKIIGSDVYARIDYPADEKNGISAKSVISGPDGTVVFNPVSGNVTHRIPLRQDVANTDMSQRSLFERIDINQLRQKMIVLGYDIVDGASDFYDYLISFQCPSGLLPKGTTKGSTVNSLKIMFDGQNGVLAGTEQTETRNDGTVVTTKVTKFYRQENDIMVPIGEQKDIHYDIPGEIEVDTDTLPVIDDPEKLPVISKEEFEKLKKDFGAYENPQAIIGDPSDPDYTETWITVYDSVKTNSLDDRFFTEVK